MTTPVREQALLNSLNDSGVVQALVYIGDGLADQAAALREQTEVLTWIDTAIRRAANVQ